MTVLKFDTCKGLTEHHAAVPAAVEVPAGRLSFTADGEEYGPRPGFWLRVAAGALTR